MAKTTVLFCSGARFTETGVIDSGIGIVWINPTQYVPIGRSGKEYRPAEFVRVDLYPPDGTGTLAECDGISADRRDRQFSGIQRAVAVDIPGDHAADGSVILA